MGRRIDRSRRKIDEELVRKSGSLYRLTEKGWQIVNEKKAIEYFERRLSEVALQAKYSGSLLWVIAHPLLADERARLLEHYVGSLYVKAPQTPADPDSDLIRDVSDACTSPEAPRTSP